MQLAGKVGYLRATEDYDPTLLNGAPIAFSSAKNTLGQARASFQVGYWLSGFMPFASVGYVSDIERKTTLVANTINPIGKNAWTWSLGANFISLSNGLTGSLAYREEAGRSNQTLKTIMGNIAWRF